MSEKSSQTSGGIGFVGILQIVFITLKLCKIISWNWWQVMLPFEILGGILILCILVIIITNIIKKR